MIALGMIEWTWGDAILNESARDVFTIAGFTVTFVGFAVTLWQLWKTQSAAKAAARAAERASQENRAAFRKFVAAISYRYLNETKIHLENRTWEKAAIRLDDMADQIAQLIGQEKDWTELSEELREWAEFCRRLAVGEIKRFRKGEWVEFRIRLETKLAGLFGPFPMSGQGAPQ